MKYFSILICMLFAFSAQISAGNAFNELSNRTAKVTKKPKKTNAVANADSIEVRKLIDAAKKGDAESQNKLGLYYYTGKKVTKNYDVALKWFSMAAKQKHVKAIANMGLCYQYGHGIKKDSVMAVKLYKESIKAGNAEFVKLREDGLKAKKDIFDINLLADLYFNGCGNTVKKDINTGFKYYMMAADEGYREAIAKVATLYEQYEKYAEALPYYQKLAAKGDVNAAYKCGEFFSKGKGTAVNKAKAADYFDIAAKKGNPNAQLMLGDLYYKGDGVQQDYSKAMMLYKSCAVKGNPAAMWNVAIMYKNGYGVKENYIISLLWFAKVSDKMAGNFNKQLNDANLEVNKGWKGTPFYDFVNGMVNLDGPAKNIDAAYKTFSAMEKNNVILASTMVGRCYADKDWKKASEKKMLDEYDKAAQAGDPYANYLLAQFYMTGGETREASSNMVVSCLEKAADGGYAPAMSDLGNLYFTGKLVNKNVTTAIKYYNSSILNGYISDSAAKNLASCYEQGLGGLKRDAVAAKSILKRGQSQDIWKDLLKKVVFE